MFEDGPKTVPVEHEQAVGGVRSLFATSGTEGTDDPWLRNR